MPTQGPAAVPASLLARVLDPSAPRPLKVAAARGALPLARHDLILALVRLSSDPDGEIASEASKTLSATPPDVLAALLGDSGTDASVLDHFARRSGTPEAVLAAIVVNPSTPDELLFFLAASADPAVLDRIVGNESRLARNPAIAEKLRQNPALSRDAHRRIIELKEHVVGHAEIAFGAPPAAPGTDLGEPLPAAEGLPPEGEGAGSEAAAPVLTVPLTPEEEAAEEALRNTPLFQRIVRMNAAEKIQVAMKGNAEERTILIRDPSRVVATSVLKSPKLNDQEIENYANLRNVSEEVLRIIGNHRDWTRLYGVAHALVRNPRTPTGISLTMLNRLVNRDLKNLGTDKNIPEVIRRSAKRLFDLRTQPPEKGKRK